MQQAMKHATFFLKTLEQKHCFITMLSNVIMLSGTTSVETASEAHLFSVASSAIFPRNWISLMRRCGKNLAVMGCGFLGYFLPSCSAILG